MTGTIFDIQRFALHDGPGIRTTVFLKGCPLSCTWCCNPESQSPTPQLGYDENKCTHCLKCTAVCPTNALSNKDCRLSVDFTRCDACGKCIGECPEAALKIYGYEADSQDVIKDVARDKEYFDNSGGGLTVSGGDPLFQPEFTIDLLKRAKALKINTCIETSAFAGQDIFEQLLPWVDYFYIDYKMTGHQKYKEFTGIPATQVLENIDYLCRNDTHVILRCTIITGINDNDEHFNSIAHLSTKYAAIKQVHVIPYHRYGEQKYRQLGLPVLELSTEKVSDEMVNSWIGRISLLGGMNVVKG